MGIFLKKVFEVGDRKLEVENGEVGGGSPDSYREEMGNGR